MERYTILIKSRRMIRMAKYSLNTIRRPVHNLQAFSLDLQPLSLDLQLRRIVRSAVDYSQREHQRVEREQTSSLNTINTRNCAATPDHSEMSAKSGFSMKSRATN